MSNTGLPWKRSKKMPNVPSTQRPNFYYSNLNQISSLQGVFFPASVRGFDKLGNVPTTYQWNFTVQRQLGNSVSAEVGYVANVGNHLLSRYDFNAPAFGAAWLR